MIDCFDIISGKDKYVFTYLYLGGLGYGFKGKQRQTVKNRIYNAVNAHGRVKINTPLGLHPEGGRNDKNVNCLVFISIRTTFLI